MKQNDIETTDKKEKLLEEVEKLKKLYKKKKEELEFADDEFEEGLIFEEMEECRQNIKKIKKVLAQMRKSDGRSDRT